MERTAAKIDANRAAGRGITVDLIAAAVNHGVNWYAVYELVGLPGYGGRDAIFDRLFGPRLSDPELRTEFPNMAWLVDNENRKWKSDSSLSGI
jgi:hypothetical protein